MTTACTLTTQSRDIILSHFGVCDNVLSNAETRLVVLSCLTQLPVPLHHLRYGQPYRVFTTRITKRLSHHWYALGCQDLLEHQSLNYIGRHSVQLLRECFVMLAAHLRCELDRATGVSLFEVGIR